MSSTTSAASAAAVPLTTSFIPPASCDRHTWVSSDCQLSTCKGIYNIVRLTDSNCFPSGWHTSQTAFSPGLICPSGYSINTQQTVTQGVGATETQASCCPVGFSIADSWPQAWYSTEQCISTSAGTTAIDYTVVGVTPHKTTRIVKTSPIIHAYPVGLSWQSSDLASATSPPSVSTTPTSTSANDAGSGSSSGLTTGAKAGIGVGAGFGGLLVLVFGAWFLFFRRKTPKEAEQAPDDPSPAPPMAQESDQQELVKLPPQPGHRTAELPGSHVPASELDAGTDVQSQPGYGAQSHTGYDPQSPGTFDTQSPVTYDNRSQWSYELRSPLSRP